MSFRALYESSKVISSGWGNKKVDSLGKHVHKQSKAKVQISPSEWVNAFVRIKDGNVGGSKPMDFTERPYLLRPYDTASRRVLYMTSRQTEKCVDLKAKISMADGSLKQAQNVVVGDLVLSLMPDGTLGTARVTWVSEPRRKASLLVRTRQGHSLRMATTHPVRVWEGWTEAGDLSVGDRVAVIRRGGIFQNEHVPEERIRLTAYLLGDGSLGGSTLGFTQCPGPVLDDFLRCVGALGGEHRVYTKDEGNAALEIRLRDLPTLKGWLREDRLLGTKSATKFLPKWVFRLSEADTALFLRSLWSTDGHISQRTRSNYLIAYSSISRKLIRQVQALLWKFGIPSRIRRNWPSYHKKKGVRKYAYILSVETKDGVIRFLNRIGALGKGAGVSLPEEAANNHFDTLPQEGVQAALDEILASADSPRKTALFAEGLHRTLGYSPNREKVLRYVSVFRNDPRFDQTLVDKLEQHTSDDLYWDRVDKITDVGDSWCVDFEVTTTHNFIADGVVTHNSTTIANRLLELAGVRPDYASLFVSPSAMQTKVFSVTRIDDIIDVSPALRALRDPRLTYNLLEKSFINGSKIYLRYAFLSADRIRGLSVNSLFLDEIQDLLTELLPVIEETTSHHKSPFFLYSGTPKTFDNTIEKLWSKSSTQNEWAIPCEAHAPYYWNILGLKNLGKKGPICSKCGKLLNPEHPQAQWVRMVEEAQFEGFRIPRLMVPWFVKDPEKWADLLKDYERYPLAQFMNEVMALSYDGGSKPITRTELRRICDDKYINDESVLEQYIGRATLYAGIDWGGGSENSFTVITVGGYVRDDTRFQILFSRRYEGQMNDPDIYLADIERLIKTYRIGRVGTDFGGGLHPNNRLVKTFGPKRVHQFQYTGRSPAKFVYKKDMHRFMVFRSPVMADIFTAMKHRKLMLPSYASYERPHIDDILSIYSEYNEALRMQQYDKPRSVADDTFHSILYCVLASYLDVRRPDIVSPILDPTISQTAHDAAGELQAMREMEDLAIMEDMR